MFNKDTVQVEDEEALEWRVVAMMVAQHDK